MSLSFPASGAAASVGAKRIRPSKRPLPRCHGSVESVCYRAVTARERSFNHRLSQQRLEILQGCGKTKWHWAEKPVPLNNKKGLPEGSPILH